MATRGAGALVALSWLAVACRAGEAPSGASESFVTGAQTASALADQAEGLFHGQSLSSLVWQLDDAEPTVVNGNVTPSALDVRMPVIKTNGDLNPVMSVTVVLAQPAPRLRFAMNHTAVHFPVATYPCATFAGEVVVTRADASQLSVTSGAPCSIAVTKKYRTATGLKGAVVGTVEAIVAETGGTTHTVRAGFAVETSFDSDDATVSATSTTTPPDAGLDAASTTPPKTPPASGNPPSATPTGSNETTPSTSSSSDAASSSDSSCAMTRGRDLETSGPGGLVVLVVAGLLARRRSRESLL